MRTLGRWIVPTGRRWVFRQIGRQNGRASNTPRRRAPKYFVLLKLKPNG
jgi:hypothetical protein